jgi:hypothetical protein
MYSNSVAFLGMFMILFWTKWFGLSNAPRHDSALLHQLEICRCPKDQIILTIFLRSSL